MTAKLCTYEHEIEGLLVRELTAAGHLCLKWISPGFPGVPDRLVLTSDGRVVLVEVKAPGQEPRRTQPKVLKMLRGMRHRVEIIDTVAQARKLVRELAA